MPQFPAILVLRKPRENEDAWENALSWFGGAPRIGRQSWPRDPGGVPLPFAAQIDLADVLAAVGPTGLPARGSLAFFIGAGAVLYSSDGADSAPAVVPPDMPDLTLYGGADFVAAKPGLFPRWPVQFVALGVPPVDFAAEYNLERFYEQEADAAHRVWPGCETYPSPEELFAGPAIPDWWRNAMQLASKVAAARDNGCGALPLWRSRLAAAAPQGGQAAEDARRAVANLEAELAGHHAAYPDFMGFCEEVQAWTMGQDPWSLMSEAEVEKLDQLWKALTKFPKLTGYWGIGKLDGLKKEMLQSLPAADTAEYAEYPLEVRLIVDEWREPRLQWWLTAQSWAERASARLPEYVEGYLKASRGDQAGVESLRLKVSALRAQLANAPTSWLLATFRRVFGGVNKLDALTKELAAGEAELAQKEATMAAHVAANAPHVARILAQEPGARSLIDEIRNWSSSREPYSVMATDEASRLWALKKTLRREFPDLGLPWLSDLESETIIALATGPHAAYAQLPEKVRRRFNTEHLGPPGARHQMFGLGADIQGGAWEMRAAGYVLLLQLSYDYAVHWSFGDCGNFQFWIKPEDIEAGRWDASVLTFDGH
jgi:hypothetical protein